MGPEVRFDDVEMKEARVARLVRGKRVVRLTRRVAARETLVLVHLLLCQEEERSLAELLQFVVVVDAELLEEELVFV